MKNMNIDLKQEFDEFVEGIPGWVKTIHDFEVYTFHLKYRLFQANKESENLYKLLKEKGDNLLEEGLSATLPITCEIDRLYQEIPEGFCIRKRANLEVCYQDNPDFG